MLPANIVRAGVPNTGELSTLSPVVICSLIRLSLTGPQDNTPVFVLTPLNTACFRAWSVQLQRHSYAHACRITARGRHHYTTLRSAAINCMSVKQTHFWKSMMWIVIKLFKIMIVSKGKHNDLYSFSLLISVSPHPRLLLSLSLSTSRASWQRPIIYIGRIYAAGKVLIDVCNVLWVGILAFTLTNTI